MEIHLTQEEKYRSNRTHQISHIEWNKQNILNWNNPLSIALTTRFIETPEIQMRKEYSKFVNRLSKRVFPNAYRRYGKLVKETAYIEYGKDNHQIHAHMLVETHPKTNISEFRNLIDKTWTFGTCKLRRVDDVDDYINQYNAKFKTKKIPDTGFIVSESQILVSKY